MEKIVAKRRGIYSKGYDVIKQFYSRGRSESGMKDTVLQAIENLSEQIATLSKKVDNQGNLMIALAEKVDKRGSQMTTLSEKVDIQGNQSNALSEKVDNQGNQSTALSEKVDNQRNQITALSEKVDSQGNQIKEITPILKALEHSVQVNKAEHDQMSLKITEISGEIKALGKNLSSMESSPSTKRGDIVKLTRPQ